MLKKIQLVILTLALVSALAIPAAAQESRGTILGRISDATGAVIPNAEVRATNIATQAAAVARTNESGNFTLPYLLPGRYTVTIEASGFRKHQQENVEVRVNDVLELNVQLSLSTVAETVEVVSETPLLETATASLGQVVDSRRVAELPIQAGNAFELTLLAPGVSNSTDMRLRKAGFNNAPSQISTDGNPQYSNEFSIDGVTNTFSSGTSARVAFSPPQSAVAEFKVQTTTFDAGLGHTIGSSVNVSTKSGSNAVHGELHHWITNSALDAYDLFQKAANQKKPVYQDNRYGASIGGPVYIPKIYNGKNKSFFFYAWEANKWGGPGTATSTVPTAAQRTGDFSALLRLGNNYQIYDPATIRDNGDGRFSRQPFPGNIIPEQRINPVARAMMQYWPLPNAAGTNDGGNNYVQPTKALEDYYVHLARVDHNFSEKHRAFIRVHYDWWEEEKTDIFNNIATGIFLNRINRGIALDDVYMIGTGTVLNLRYGLTQQEFPERRRSAGFDLASLGFSPSLVALTDPEKAPFPRVTLSSYTGFSDWETGDGTNTSIVHTFTGNLNTLRGSHNLRYGAEFRLYREFGNRFQFDITPSLSFDTTWTRGPFNNSTGAPRGQDMAAFLLGLPGGEMRRSASYAEQDKFWAFYVQDDWKLTRKLTVNLGLRYELETPMTERFDRAVKGFDFNVASPIEAAARANYARSPIPQVPLDQFRARGGLLFAGGGRGHDLWNGETNNFAPRIGLAYQITPKTIFRTGYGMFFETIGTNRSTVVQDGFTQSTPVTLTNNNGISFFTDIRNPFPNGLLPPSPSLRTNLGQTVRFYQDDRKHPYSQRWSAGVQRELPGQWVIETSYVGNRATRLQIERNLNPVPGEYLSRSPERDQTTINFLTGSVPNPFYGLDPNYTSTTIQRQNLLRPFPHFGDVLVTEPIGYSWYHSLQVRSEKRFSRGYTMQFAYTWSKMMEATQFLNPSDPMPYESISSFDRQQRLAASGIFELPFGRNRRFASNIPGWLNHVIGGWQINAVAQHQSGAPFDWGNVLFRGNFSDIALDRSERTLERWFNTDAGFEKNSNLQLANNIRTFPLRISGVRNKPQARWDISTIKYFPITEQVKIQFRAEAYNAFNHPNIPNNPQAGPTNSAFGRITGQVRQPRQLQFALRLMF